MPKVSLDLNLDGFMLALGKALVAHSFQVVYSQKMPDHLLRATSPSTFIDAANVWCDMNAQQLRLLATIAKRAQQHLPRSFTSAMKSFNSDILTTFQAVDRFLKTSPPPGFLTSAIAEGMRNQPNFTQLCETLQQLK